MALAHAGPVMSRTASGTVAWRGTPARWWARLTVRTADGGTRRMWVDLERPDLKNTPDDKRAAKRLALKRAKLASKTKFVGVEKAAAPKVTLAELEEKWFAHLARDPDLAIKTVDGYRTSWVQLVDQFGKMAVTSISPLVIREWVWRRRNERSASTVLNECIALSRFFEDAIGERWVAVTVNPARDRLVRDAKPKPKQTAAEDIVRLSKDQLETLLAAEDMPDDFFGLVLFDALTGAREGEARGPQFKHLRDPRDGKPCVNIVQQVVGPTEDKPAHVGPPKRGSKRMNPMHSQLATWLEWWRSEGWAAFVGRAPTDEDFVFPDSEGDMCRPRDPDTLRKWMAKATLPTSFILQDGTEEPFTFNAIRRTFASLLGDLDVDGELLDDLIGHKPRSVRARHYQGTWFERKLRAVERLQLKLRERPGVALTPAPESSSESSQAPEPANDTSPRQRPTGHYKVAQGQDFSAEEEGFEPTDPLRDRRFSKPVP